MTNEELRQAAELVPEATQEPTSHPVVTHHLRDAETQIETPPDVEVPVEHPGEATYGSLGF